MSNTRQDTYTPRGSLDGRPVMALYKMAAIQEKSFGVLENAKCSSVMSIQHTFLHWSTIVSDFLNRELPHRWIGHAGLDDVPLFPWSPGRQMSHHVISSCEVM
ncbi:hypothetical protein AVEN_152633-1 [Araneus ventricosus]|uniref:Uncharacterized protein n=1 Tax=Araneus ventricosus TaxID=182803 RepID=A0A4Y2RYE5_ARAVE|nr:hypothetical protein AVEN_269326-1 [Araneus ventricosus]GBN80020.1 hypothetical protein AVEN_152633-1 [Araneus ventricosus]